MNFGQLVSVLMSVLLIGGGLPAAAQDKPAMTTLVPTKVVIEKDSVRDTYVASFQEEGGSGKAWIVKDPNSLEVQGSHVKGDSWTRVTHLGQSPWGKPGTLNDIRKDPKVRQNIKTMTTLNSQQQSALNKGLDSSEGWVTVKASELPILEAFWGNGWQKYKVLMELETRFSDTEVYLYFSPEIKEWFAFYSYCRNLGQPFVGYVWQELVTENAVPPKPVVPAIVEPKCSSLKSLDGSSAPLIGADRRIYVAEFSNPSGLDLSVSYKLTEKKTGRVMPLSTGDPKIEINATWLDPGQYLLQVDAIYNGRHINTERCTAELAVALPPPPPPALSVKVDQPPKKGHGLVWAIVGIAAAGGVAAAFAGRGKSNPSPTIVKIPDTVPGGKP